MSERSYTVKQIDDLRSAVEHKWLFGSYTPQRSEDGISCGRSYRAGEKTACVEELVRTHMLAGHTAEDLYASEADDDE